MECYVFVDDSNLWIAGQHVAGKKLKDADIDPRFRVRLDRFLDMVVTEKRKLKKAFLYGSRPPENDKVWKAAEEKGFEVKVYERSVDGSEKEVDTAMATDIADLASEIYYTGDANDVTFISVTGDRDLRPPIRKAMGKGIQVELWSWEHSMSQAFHELDKTEKLFTANTLDTVQDSFSFLEETRTCEKIKLPANTIVYRDVPRNSHNTVRDHMLKLSRLFYITRRENGRTQDLIVMFPNTKIGVVREELHKLGKFEFNFCSYTEYSSHPEYGHPSCYLFIDDSNLWIEDQKAVEDSRYKVDLGKFVQQVVPEGFQIAEVFVPAPPPNDSIWNAAREKDFAITHEFEEKNVITQTLHQLDEKAKSLVKFIVITSSFIRPIVDILKNEIAVDLWSWKDSMPHEYQQLASTNKLFTACTLDAVASSFGYTARLIEDKMFPTRIDPAHAIVYKDVSGGKGSQFMLADHIHRMSRRFHISSIKKGLTQDLIVTFPNTKIEVVFKKLRKLGKFKLALPCSYPEYKSQLRQQASKIQTTFRFESLGGIEIDAIQDVVEESMSSDMENIFTEEEPESSDDDAHDDWETEVRRKVAYSINRNKTECKWHEHCTKATKCPYLHTLYEKRIFELFPKKLWYFKTRECNKKYKHEWKWCAFAHNNEDSWCLSCTKYGHLTDNCPVKYHID